MNKRTLFLDRDGVVNILLINDYVKNVAEFKLREDFLRSIPLLVAHFEKIFIVTNQQGISKGVCTAAAVSQVHQHLRQQLLHYGLTITNIYVCPHLAGSGCHCRKPEIGMALQAQADYPDVNFAHSVMIGDSASDMRFGRRCGMETVFIGSVTAENRQAILADSDHIVSSIYQYVCQLQ